MDWQGRGLSSPVILQTSEAQALMEFGVYFLPRGKLGGGTSFYQCIYGFLLPFLLFSFMNLPEISKED